MLQALKRSRYRLKRLFDLRKASPSGNKQVRFLGGLLATAVPGASGHMVPAITSGNERSELPNVKTRSPHRLALVADRPGNPEMWQIL